MRTIQIEVIRTTAAMAWTTAIKMKMKMRKSPVNQMRYDDRQYYRDTYHIYADKNTSTERKKARKIISTTKLFRSVYKFVSFSLCVLDGMVSFGIVSQWDSLFRWICFAINYSEAQVLELNKVIRINFIEIPTESTVGFSQFHPSTNGKVTFCIKSTKHT